MSAGRFGCRGRVNRTGGSRILPFGQFRLSPGTRRRGPGNSPSGTHLRGMPPKWLLVQPPRSAPKSSLHRRGDVQCEEVDDAAVTCPRRGCR